MTMLIHRHRKIIYGPTTDHAQYIAQGVPPATWVPSDLGAGLKLWYKPWEEHVALADGAAVPSLANYAATGHSYDLAQVVALRPTWNAAKKSIALTGGQCLTTPAGITVQDGVMTTMWVVMTGEGDVVSFNSNWYVYAIGTMAVFAYYSTNYTATAAGTVTTPAALHAQVSRIGSAANFFRQDGVDTLAMSTSDPIVASPGGPTDIGQFNYIQPFEGLIKEVGLYVGTLTAEDLANLEQYLAGVITC